MIVGRPIPWLGIAPLLLFLLVLLVWPVLSLLLDSLADGAGVLGHYQRLWETPIYRRALGTTLMIASLVTVLSVLLSYPLAYLLATSGPVAARLLLFVVLLPFWTSALVRTAAWIVLLQRNGVLNSLLTGSGLLAEPMAFVYNLSGVLIGMTHVLMPFVVLPLYAAFRGLDANLVQAARGLGAGSGAVFRRVVLPLTAPGVLAGGLIVFMNALGYYITPALMGGPGQTMIAELIAYHLLEALDWGMAAALAILLLAVTLAVFALFQRFFSLERLWGGAAGGGVASPLAGERRGPGGRLAALAALAVAAFLIAPIVVVFPMSFGSSPFLAFPPADYSLRWYVSILDNPKWWRATVNSLQVAGMAVVLASLLGTAAALGLSRLRGRFTGWLEGLFVMPMVMPAIVVALALYYFYAPLGWLGTLWGLALGHTLLAAPFVFITVRAALKNLDPNLELAARGLGAGWSTVFLRVWLPAIWPGIAGGAVFAFIVSFDDVVIALFLTNIRTRTLPKVMFEGIAHEIDPTIISVAALLILVSLTVLVLNLLLRRR